MLFITNVVNQGISHPSVGSALLLVSLLLLLSLDLTVLQHDFVVSSYAIKIFLQANSALFLLVLCFLYFLLFRGYCSLPFTLLSLTTDLSFLYILYCPLTILFSLLFSSSLGWQCSLLDYRD